MNGQSFSQNLVNQLPTYANNLKPKAKMKKRKKKKKGY